MYLHCNLIYKEMKFKIAFGLCIFKILLISIWLFFYDDTNHSSSQNNLQLGLNGKSENDVSIQNIDQKDKVNELKPYKSKILSLLKKRSNISPRDNYIDKEIVIENQISNAKEVKEKILPDRNISERFIMHINYADDFKTKYTGFGMRFGMAIPEICPIDPAVQLGPGLFLGISGNYNVYGSNPYNISQDTFESYIDQGFSTWVNSSLCNNTNGWNIFNSGSNDSTTPVVFQRNNNNDFLFFDLENESILAVTILWLENQPGGLAITEADVIFNSNLGNFKISDLRYPSENRANSFNLFDIIIHEIGHFIGIGHTPGDAVCEPAIMFPSLQPGIRKEILSEVDKSAIRDLFENHGLCSSTMVFTHWNVISLFLLNFFVFSLTLF